ncbi:hypothetical protein GCM10025876_25260 [Demequina litorisediminis]|uniref:Uncharacterized protein n=1 Tax=Demequina litorisediminis TaxID=1849022 RepID=A0ABQ6IHU8_9MICO|nr:hypothetical protein GCM10025876_25260 [Demequina litorisediminis]
MPCDLVIARDHRRERRLGVGVHILIGDADRVVIGGHYAVLPDEQVEDVVGSVGHARDGSEDPHTADRSGQQAGDPEGDGGLTGIALGRCDVDASSHATILTRLAGMHAMTIGPVERPTGA